jgi:ATP-dependent DNA helicase RecG
VADIEDAMRFVARNTRAAWKIEALQRHDIPEYPMKALREAIINAVMHRDWFMDGANVFVELYTDRIEVVSPGGLPKGMTLADLGRKAAQDGTRAGPSRDQVGTKWQPRWDKVEVLRRCREEQPLTSLLEAAGRSNRTKFRTQVLAPLLAKGLLEPTIPDKPRSSKQRYRLTAAGVALLEKDGQGATHRPKTKRPRS